MSENQLNNNAELEKVLAQLRPDLHRYLARMMGSVFDGEDVLQEVMLSAFKSKEKGVKVENMCSWMFRIAHNTALNALRAQKSDRVMKENLIEIEDIASHLPSEGGTSDALLPFMALTPKQRSTVILFDVLGYDAAETAELTGLSIDATKSALKRGRVALRNAPVDEPVELDDEHKQVLQKYASCFNAHEFDTIRDMLADEVKLDVVSLEKRIGSPAVSKYFGNYSKAEDWLMVAGQVESQPAMLVFERETPENGPVYVVRIDIEEHELVSIQDFRYARYVMNDVHWKRI